MARSARLDGAQICDVGARWAFPFATAECEMNGANTVGVISRRNILTKILPGSIVAVAGFEYRA